MENTEEPPLVFALKANQYAATSADSESDDVIFPRIEMRIQEMVQIMLKYYPEAASRCTEGSTRSIHSSSFSRFPWSMFGYDQAYTPGRTKNF
jgi:hypothetical protein